jgi:hypothetical protein
MNQHFAEKVNVCQGFLPVDMAAGANAGDYVSLKNYGRCAIVLFKEPGTAGDDPTITLTQATDISNSLSDAKALNITTVYKKQAATNLLAVGTYTKSTSASPASLDTFSANTWTNSALAEQAAIIIIDVKAEDLDIDNGFDCITVSIADVGTTGQLGALLYLLHEPRHQTAPLQSAIID